MNHHAPTSNEHEKYTKLVNIISEINGKRG